MQSSKHEISFPVIFLCLASCISFFLSYLPPTNKPTACPIPIVSDPSNKHRATYKTSVKQTSADGLDRNASVGHMHVSCVPPCMWLWIQRRQKLFHQHCSEASCVFALILLRWLQISAIVCFSGWISHLCPNEETQTK